MPESDEYDANRALVKSLCPRLFSAEERVIGHEEYSGVLQDAKKVSAMSRGRVNVISIRWGLTGPYYFNHAVDGELLLSINLHTDEQVGSQPGSINDHLDGLRFGSEFHPEQNASALVLAERITGQPIIDYLFDPKEATIFYLSEH